MLLVTVVLALLVQVEQLVVVLVVGGGGLCPRRARGHAARVLLGVLAGPDVGHLGGVVHEAVAEGALGRPQGDVAGPYSAK